MTRCTAYRRSIDQRHARTLLRKIVGNTRPYDAGADDRYMTPIAGALALFAAEVIAIDESTKRLNARRSIPCFSFNTLSPLLNGATSDL